MAENGEKAPSLLEADRVRSMIAYVVVIGGIGAILVTGIAQGTAASDRLLNFLVGSISIVLGFYFGRQGFEDVKQGRDEALKEALEDRKLLEEGGARLQQRQAMIDRLKAIAVALAANPDLEDKLNEALAAMESGPE